MGLTKEVREFFTGRINRLLNEKLENIYSKIDRNAIRAQAVTRLLVEVGIPATVLKRFAEIEAERDRLYAEQNEIKNLVCNSIEKTYPKTNISRYSNSSFEVEIEHFATKKFEGKVLGEVHPELMAEINKINAIKEDVEGVVLLSTTEPKLVARLTSVLEKYGGGIPELLEFIPD